MPEKRQAEKRESSAALGPTRRRDVSRLEGFSDAVFGFAITLLVVSLVVPSTFDELLRSLAGVPAFAVSFALLASIWYAQYTYFRRYNFEDVWVVVLNLVLLFVVLIYVYPLKFLYATVVNPNPAQLRPDQRPSCSSFTAWASRRCSRCSPCCTYTHTDHERL